MALENKLGFTDSAELAREEERISKARALELFEKGLLDTHVVEVRRVLRCPLLDHFTLNGFVCYCPIIIPAFCVSVFKFRHMILP